MYAAPGPSTGTRSEKIARVIAAAKSQTGKGLSYSWGGGGRSGPTCGIRSPSPGGHIDYNVYGFDCSGLMQYAFWAGAGVNISGYSTGQSLKGTRIPYSSAGPGDLIFWNNPGSASTYHVALLIGNGQMIEAAPPRGTSSVHVTKIYGAHSYAVRIIN
jgi:cell wall-associated NlpC family hydrolase